MPSKQIENPAPSQAISIDDAMSILTLRAKSGGEKGALQAATPELKKLGQTLDLMNSQKWTRDGNGVGDSDGCCDPSSVDTQAMSSETKENENANTDQSSTDASSTNGKSDTSQTSKLQQELAKLPPKELLVTLFNLQQQRVEVYLQFNSGLDTVLQSGNLSAYPDLTTNITASFVVISNSIRGIQQLFQKGDAGDNDVAGFINKLQVFEKEKLNITAALHLEKIRERNERLVLEEAQGDSDSDERILLLLKKGVKELEAKMSDCMENITEILEELRYANHDLEE